MKNPFYEIVKPYRFCPAATVCEMERTWDKAIEKALEIVATAPNIQEMRLRLTALKSTNQRGDPKV